MKTSLEHWLVVLWLITLFSLGGTSMYQSDVINQQRHTIRQCMNLEDGPDATPRPPKAVIPSCDIDLTDGICKFPVVPKKIVPAPMWNKDPVRQDYRRQMRLI